MLRKPFILTMHELAEKDPRVLLIVGDVGFSFMEDFYKKYPTQFLNVGAAEQTMMGMAYGLSKAGWKPVVYTMINFICFRPYEQVRNDLCYQNANVKLFGVAGSTGYKFLGFSHNIEENEDEMMLGHLPNMKTHYPKTEEETRKVMLEEYEREGPSYTRI